MLRIFDTCVLNNQLYSFCKDKQISINIFEDNTVLFFLKDKKNILAKLPENFYFENNNNELHIIRKKTAVKNFEKLFYHKITGTYRSLINNAINGLLKNYVKNLLIMGSGYRSVYNKQNHSIEIFVGYANSVEYFLQKTVSVDLASNGTEINLKSYNKQHVTQDAANIIKIKKPNVYSGSGIHDKAKKFTRKEVKKT